ncbi:MAG: polyribonucleotide nucleotidyltransferase [Patescibacteria group bacterium]
MAINKKQYSIEVAGKTLTLEISSLAEQANAAVLARYGETIVLATAVMNRADSSLDYLPLRVDYEERFYAAGKVLGSRFMRREGRPSEDGILTGRLVDRILRPLFDNRIRRDIQVVTTVLSYDEEHDPGFVALMAASAALHISDIPWAGPVGAVGIAEIEGKIIINPVKSQIKDPKCVFESFVAGPKGTINMIELGGREAKEEMVLSSFMDAQKEIDRLVDFIEGIRTEIGKPKTEVKLSEPDEELKKAVLDFVTPRINEAVFGGVKADKKSGIGVLKHELFEHLKTTMVAEGKAVNFKAADFVFEEEVNQLVHNEAIKNEHRPDGRKLDEVRGLSAEIKLFERTHGSALFTRGSTQALAVVTLAPPGSEQLIEGMETTERRNFLLHYNFPPYSVGEVGMFRGPGRREIGHGALAMKAIRAMVPTIEEFPYTIRVVSEIMSSNGSSSMASACAAGLAMMDAGVPIKKLVAGIAMGLMTDETGNFKVLTDIQGPEDHHGDMDFKVAGTDAGVTAVQLDVKFRGVTKEMIEKTLAQAKQARLHILETMTKAISAPRSQLSKYAPAIEMIRINPEKIGMVIGPGGKMINGLIKAHGLLTIDIEEDGRVYVSADDRAKVDRAIQEIQGLTKDYQVGDIIEGNIIKLLDFGAIVDIGGGRDGMIHVSELKEGFVKNVTDVVKEGDFVRAKVIRVDMDGKIGLSLKQLS